MRGNPPGRGAPATRSWVYPRACGGTSSIIVWTAWRLGLSPRMRGNLHVFVSIERENGSIPAHAGEPCLRTSRSAPRRVYHRVYPRACGGTCGGSGAGSTWRGLSPRMRGNLVAGRVGLYVLGSIPAHAGEPSTVRTMRARSRVYPRACGGTACVAMVQTLRRGLSPRMRGNQERVFREAVQPGSIPAHAGEPDPVLVG